MVIDCGVGKFAPPCRGGLQGEMIMVKIAPSILSADFARLGADIDSVGNADYIHFDVMDGVFVPNISVGLPVLESVRKYTDMFIDVHLMITEPKKYVKAFADAGADLVVFHVEADDDSGIAEAVEIVKGAGKKAGIALKPATPAEAVEKYIDKLDLVLVMTVEPGFGGQKFMADQMGKVSAVRRMIDERGLDCELEVDGGVNRETIVLAKEAGADVFVAGSSVFKAPDRKAEIEALRNA